MQASDLMPASPPPAWRTRLALYLDLIRWDRPAGWLLLLFGKEKKENYLALLESGPSEALMVAICDKIHNMSTMSEPLVHKGTFWFLDLVQEILNGRQQEIPESLYNKFVDRLNTSKQIFTNIDR
jgi:hypothetical protein